MARVLAESLSMDVSHAPACPPLLFEKKKTHLKLNPHDCHWDVSFVVAIVGGYINNPGSKLFI